jgi:hypothetical protein
MENSHSIKASHWQAVRLVNKYEESKRERCSLIHVVPHIFVKIGTGWFFKGEKSLLDAILHRLV